MNQVVVVHVFNPSALESKAGRSLEFKANLLYRTSSRFARVTHTHKNPVSKNIIYPYLLIICLSEACCIYYHLTHPVSLHSRVSQHLNISKLY